MDGAGQPGGTSLDRLVNCCLQVGRLLLLNGAETEDVRHLVARLAASFGAEARMMVSYETLLLTLVSGEDSRTRIGYRLPGLGVGMSALAALSRVVKDAEQQGSSLDDVHRALEAIEHAGPAYPRWLVAAGLAITAASLARLFGGDWSACGAAGVAGLFGTWVRLELGRRHANPVVTVFLVALLSGLIGGGLMLLVHSTTPALAIVAPGMILVPGVPLINGIVDMIRNHVTMGMSRLGFASVLTLSIGLGIFAATKLTGVDVALNAPMVTVDVLQDAVFSALAACGFALLFNVPVQMAWACAVCGVASHTLRTLLYHCGIDLISGSLIGALLAGLLARGFAGRFGAPTVTLAFAGVVAMVPGAFAFRAVFGALRIAEGGARDATISETLSLLATVGLMVGAIAVGIAVPAAVTGPAGKR